MTMIALIMGINSPAVENVVNNEIVEETPIEVVFESYVGDDGLHHWSGESLNGNEIVVNEENDGWFTAAIQYTREEEITNDTGEWEGRIIHARNYVKFESIQVQFDIFDDVMMEELMRTC
jgi:hypothetical protein